MARLTLVVELLAEPLGQLLGDLAGVDLGAHPPLQRQHHAELAEIGFDRRLHVGILQLHGQVPAVEADRAVHLAERGGRGRHPLERAEALLPARPKLGEHAPLDEGRPHGRRRRLELLQLRGEFRRQQIGDRRHQLGELHHRPLEAAERRGEVGGILRVGEIAAEEPGARHARRHPADIGAHPRVAGQAAGEAVLFAVGRL